jgi:serine phosphatase RsbU (regulator of sigma subunit)
MQTHNERLRDRLKDDLRQGNYWNKLKEDYSELHEYFIDKEKNERLKYMGVFSRFFHLNWWLLKAMIFKLTPVRRLLFVLGFTFTLFGGIVKYGNADTTNISILGGTILIFILMLELKDKLLAKSELGEGRQVQQALMPPEQPDAAGWDIWLYSFPANDVGGDLVDFIKRKDGSYILTVGDVSGKGLGAALFSIKLQSSLRALSGEPFELREIISKVNDLFYKDGIHSRFSSLISFTVKENSDKVTYVNAGHMPPIIYSDGKITELPKGDIALGLMDSPEFNLCELNLTKDDAIIAYSDGVVEAENQLHYFYGKARFLELIEKYGNEPAEKLGQKIIRDVNFFRNDYKIHDDISIAIIKRTG